MPLIARRLAILVLVFAAPQVRADAKPQAALDIRPIETDQWKADLADVKKVLESAAGELWKHFPDRKLDAIIVEPRGGPIVLFKRGKKGEYFVRLNTDSTYWAQYAYQFAHEMTHILAGYREGEGHVKWFEESLCELASLYALRSMAETWKEKPPYPNWKGYAAALKKYADDRMEKSKLKEGTTLAQWYSQNAEQLSKEATQRELNQVVATALLPLFEKEPSHWEALTWLNAGELKADAPRRDLAQYLAAWRANVPEKHREFVADVAKELGVTLKP